MSDQAANEMAEQAKLQAETAESLALRRREIVKILARLIVRRIRCLPAPSEDPPAFPSRRRGRRRKDA